MKPPAALIYRLRELTGLPVLECERELMRLPPEDWEDLIARAAADPNLYAYINYGHEKPPASPSTAAKRSVFYKDDCLGHFEGNILEAVAPLFPPSMAEQIRRHSPIQCKWQVFERITWDGYRGHRFYTSQDACDALNSICDTLYEERHRPPGYPGMYSENTELEGLPKVAILKAYFVVWQPDKVAVPGRPHKTRRARGKMPP